MRLPLIPPADLSAEQRTLYDDMRAGIATGYSAFKVEREDGALMGPWNASLHDPQFGTAWWNLTKAIGAMGAFPPGAREVAILVVGARFNAAYELYAHVAVAESLGMPAERISTLVAGHRPKDLDCKESAAFDVASRLCQGGVLPEALYRHACATFGPIAVRQLIYLVGLYAMVSMTLNAFNVPVPDCA